jgi:hypothetical protein
MFFTADYGCICPEELPPPTPVCPDATDDSYSPSEPWGTEELGGWQGCVDVLESSSCWIDSSGSVSEWAGTCAEWDAIGNAILNNVDEP